MAMESADTDADTLAIDLETGPRGMLGPCWLMAEYRPVLGCIQQS